jgi:NDP-sugar pyrophosphorylase family protein
MKGVVLAAGKGTRMRAVSLGIPKMLLPLGEGTVVGSVVLGLKNAGVSEVLLVVGHMEEQVRGYFGDGSSFGIAIEYVRQEKLSGTGDAASLARDFVGQDPFFFLAYGDIATPLANYAGLVADFLDHPSEAGMSIYPAKDPSHGAAVYVENGYLKKLIEKPPKGTACGGFDNAGIYIFTPKVFDMLSRIGTSPRGECELTDALTLLVKEGNPVRTCEFGGFWSNVSSPEDLLEVNKILIDQLDDRRSPASRTAASGAEISPLSLINPKARLGRCLVGDYTVAAAGSEIADEAKVSNAIICGDAVIGRGCILDHVLVSPGATIEPGSRCEGTEGRVLILPQEAVKT